MTRMASCYNLLHVTMFQTKRHNMAQCYALSLRCCVAQFFGFEMTEASVSSVRDFTEQP